VLDPRVKGQDDMSQWVRTVTITAAIATASACGGGGGSNSGGNPGGPSGGPIVGSTGAVGAIGATITIANGAVSPGSVTISVGQSVRFVNSDSRLHDMSSDPHPVHTNCPSINNVGNIAPGQTKDTMGFSGSGSCGFHDHNDPENGNLQGRITIQ
jgi:plastocyanin